MKCASDFREIARNALRGKWGIAVIVGLVAALLGGTSSNGPEINLELEGSRPILNLELAGQTLFSTSRLTPEVGGVLAGAALYVLLVTLAVALIHLFLGSVVGVGYARFNLELVDHKEVGFDHLFKYFPHYINAVYTRLLSGLYIILWSLLLIIPGLIAAYRYAMTEYILAEHPEMTASEVLAESKRMMDGHKMRLFCLHLSFIGWDILATLSLGIGYLWLNPYKNAATAAFYREISGTEQIRQSTLQDDEESKL